MPARKLTPAQVAVLRAAVDGKLSRQYGYPYRWHAAGADGAFAPRSATCDVLLDRGLVNLDFGRQNGQWVPAAVTDAGRALLDTLNPEG